MKENALVPKAPIDKQLEASIAWLDTVVAEVKKKINDDPKTVVNTIKQIEVYEMGAKRAKVTELVHKAAEARLQLSRELGLYLIKHATPGGGGLKQSVLKTLGLSYNESTTFKRIASLTEYHWSYAIQHFPSLNGCVKEYERYEALKTMLETNKVKDKDAKLKEYILSGVSAFKAENELKNGKLDDEDDEEWCDGEADDEEDEVKRKPTSKEKQKDAMLRENIAILEKNAKDIGEYFDNLTRFLTTTKSCTKLQYKAIVENIKIIKEKADKVFEGTKALKERIND